LSDYVVQTRYTIGLYFVNGFVSSSCPFGEKAKRFLVTAVDKAGGGGGGRKEKKMKTREGE
jgi:hypothetical protein